MSISPGWARREVAVSPPLVPVAVSIPSGTSIMAAGVDIGGAGIVRILMPAAWTAAALTAQVSQDDATYYDLYDSTGTEWSATVVAAHAVALDITTFTGVRYLKLRSGTGAAPVAQAATRSLTLVTRAL
jgi:hypothetical protein